MTHPAPAPHSASSPVALERVGREFLERLQTPSRVLIAYSGGGDSTGLMVALALCLKANPHLDVRLEAATVDHGLRPESADEARSAGALCNHLSLPHHILTWQGDKPQTGVQAAAREARYRLLGNLARTIGADIIVTAHNLDDQFETVAMRKARNPDAAGGISQAVLYDRRIWIYRPLLDVGRTAIRDYLVLRNIRWVDDPSNDNDQFERVRVRKSLQAGQQKPVRVQNPEPSLEIADSLRANTVLHSGRVAMLDMWRYDAQNPAHLQAVRYLAAMMGGRTHLASAGTTARIAAFLAQSDEKRMTAERCVFDRRKRIVYITRERRGLPSATVEPGSSVIWDNRFRIGNHSGETAVISVRHAGMSGAALLAQEKPQHLPGAVHQRIEETEPTLIAGQIEGLIVEPIIVQFDRFLPLELLPIANALAFLGGLDHFPRLPTR